MNKSTSAFLILLASLLFLILSCGKNANSPEQKIKVAMLAAGTTFDDMAFLQSCKSGLELAKADFDLECEYDIDTTTNQYQERLEYFCEQNFDLIIAVGYMWNDAVIQTAKNYTETAFVMVDAELSEPQPNAMSILFDVDEAAYPLGFLSAWWASNHGTGYPALGYVGALEIMQIRQFTEPYINGMDYYNQNYGDSVVCYGDYAGTFIDSTLGKEIADSLILLGADVIYGVGGLTGNGALLKAKEMDKVGVGVDVDQFFSFPEVAEIILSSAMKRLDNSIYAVVGSYVEDAFSGGEVYTGNLANEGVQLAPYHNYESQIADSIKLEVENIKAGIIDGSISTGW